MTKKSSFSVFVASLIIMATLVAPVGAISDNRQGNVEGEDGGTSQQVNQPEDAGTGKLDEAKLRVCEAREARIKNMFENANQLGQGQFNLFDNITNKVIRFYEDNKLVVNDYDELLNNLNQAKISAQEAVDAAYGTAAGFSCDSEDPKGTANQFKAMVQTQIQELKNYRLAIKDLVSAVRTAAIETSEE